MKSCQIHQVLAFGMLSSVLAIPSAPATQCGVGGDGSDFYTSKTVKDMGECQLTCKSDIKCQSSEYKPSTGICWLFSKPVAQAKTKNDNSGTWFFNDRDCPIITPVKQCNVGGDGSDYYTSKTVKTVIECQTACKNDTKCQSSEYKPSTGACWLFSKPVEQAKTSNDNTGTWFFNDRDCPIPQCAVGGDGSDFYTSNTVASIQACQTSCKNDAKCQSSEYKPSTGVCWLFSKPVEQAKTSNDSTGTWIFNDRDCPITK